MKITPSNAGGSHRTGTLSNMTVAKIVAVLGFQPNYDDDPDKVENSWSFDVDGVQCGIWDYRGSHHFNSFSTYGPDEVFEKLFGADYKSMNWGRTQRIIS